jgi:predicted nucleic acid-binding protein
MNPPTTLLDHGFLVAVADPTDEHHAEAADSYRQLIDDFVGQRCLLVARADHLDLVSQPDLFAPVAKMHVAKQHRDAAAAIVDDDIDSELAVTLVLLQRYRIRSVATFDDRLAHCDLEVLSKQRVISRRADQLSN